jgi:ATP-dependent helicase HrpA
VAWERVTLHGLMIHAKRRVHYGPSDPKLAREILIREALVEGQVGEDWVRKWRFFQHNAKLMKEIEALEHKSRRPDVLVDDELIHAFYDAGFPRASSPWRPSTTGGARRRRRTRSCSAWRRSS